ncbi:hypothetical protein MHU86_8449 [Fragilaria crotonensis]|nr:hypothetical protein MHU86_8449 [Fragilaria crotonensis]
MPDPRTGLSPHDVFTKTRWEQKKLMDVHVWGCPVYVLDKMISDGKKLPRWTPRSTRTVNLVLRQTRQLGPLVLNPQTGYITPQFHIVFDDWFATVPASADDLPNFNDDCWQRMFRDSTFQYVLDDEDEERLIAGSTDYEQTNCSPRCNASQPLSTTRLLRRFSQSLRLRCQLRCRLQGSKLRRHHQSLCLLPCHSVADSKEATPQPPTPIVPQLPTLTPVKLFPSSPTPIPSCERKRQEVSEQPVAPKATKAKSTPVKHEPRRSTRNRSAPVRLGYDGQQGHGYIAEFDGTSSNGLQ